MRLQSNQGSNQSMVRDAAAQRVRAELASFGLNPHDWKIEAQDHRQVRLSHHHEPTLRLLAALCAWPGRPVIDSLELLEL